MTTTSTQQAHPVRASWRTATQTVISVILVLGVVAPIVAAILHDELGEYLPEAWLAWVVAAGAVLAAVSAALARIMAIPAVDAWLRHLGLSSTPKVVEPDADGVHIITSIVDTSAPAGYEVPEVSAAKDEIADRVRDLLGYHDVDIETAYTTPRDPIHEADVIVEKLLALGWRPTA
ncbi:hypothetical protein RDI86_01530 [Cellulosimicrobium sp. XJ-DQ-B-000]|uniref:hypothetical protein n=1 Tax=Cellulosimicrobium sp. XJ-DQ-B-000 TaxID=3072182 RepID=UPI0028089695|nr:hypothetical protein [Cellulosimicrobium sp. XJ-DQ-B-000]MDQ8040530.1 hypothetical protein [Cellulosimicrobium sp. XJ-DQ-B-000]